MGEYLFGVYNPVLIVTISFFFKIQELRKEGVKKINDFLKAFHQLNDSLKTATQIFKHYYSRNNFQEGKYVKLIER